MDLLCYELIFSSAECIGVHYRLAAAAPRRWNNSLTRACEDSATRTTTTYYWVEAASHCAVFVSGTLFMEHGNAANYGSADNRIIA